MNIYTYVYDTYVYVYMYMCIYIYIYIYIWYVPILALLSDAVCTPGWKKSQIHYFL